MQVQWPLKILRKRNIGSRYLPRSTLERKGNRTEQGKRSIKIVGMFDCQGAVPPDLSSPSRQLCDRVRARRQKSDCACFSFSSSSFSRLYLPRTYVTTRQPRMDTVQTLPAVAAAAASVPPTVARSSSELSDTKEKLEPTPSKAEDEESVDDAPVVHDFPLRWKLIALCMGVFLSGEWILSDEPDPSPSSRPARFAVAVIDNFFPSRIFVQRKHAWPSQVYSAQRARHH